MSRAPGLQWRRRREGMKDYLLIGGALIVGWLLISRPMSKQEAANSAGAKFVKNVMSLAVAGAAVWFAWWVLSTRCAGAC
jgi:hypothetical protein